MEASDQSLNRRLLFRLGPLPCLLFNNNPPLPKFLKTFHQQEGIAMWKKDRWLTLIVSAELLINQLVLALLQMGQTVYINYRLLDEASLLVWSGLSAYIIGWSTVDSSLVVSAVQSVNSPQFRILFCSPSSSWAHLWLLSLHFLPERRTLSFWSSFNPNPQH